MSGKSGKSLRTGGTPQTVNVLNINGNLFALGDIRHAEFSSLEDPVASVNSLLAWAKALNQILKGIPPEPPVDCESMAEAAGVTPTATTTIGDVVTALNNKGAGINPNTGTIEDIIEAL